MKHFYSIQFLIFLLAGLTQAAYAHEARLETGAFETISNRFNIPNPGGSRVLVKDKSPQFYARAQLTFRLSENGFLRLMAAPLKAEYSFLTNAPVTFNGVTIPAQNTAKVIYQFNSYRLGYLYRFWDSPIFSLRAGIVGKIREAKIEVWGNGENRPYSNIGFVPLFNLGLNWNFYDPLSLRFDIDGAAAKQGRAFDGALELFYQLDDMGSGMSAGVRVLEGGAENSKVNTFALFQYVFVAGTLAF